MLKMWGDIMIVGVCSDVGRVRDVNQDSFYSCEIEGIELFVVADGMGGCNGGEIASEIVIDTIKEITNKYKESLINQEIEIPKFINDSINESNKRIYEKALEIEKFKGMGTTVTMAYISSDEIFIGHIGDSRAYLIRDEEIFQITQDHSLVAELVRNGSISKKEAINHPQKNIITRAVGTDKEVRTDVISRKIQSGDIILLCTDGLTNMISNEIIKDMLIKSQDPQKVSEKLVYTANELGGLDNITALVIEIV